MKFETKFGLGEICTYHDDSDRGGRQLRDLLVKIVSINLGDDLVVSYGVEHVTSTVGMQRFHTTETNLGGDPDYDQEAGCYPADDTGGTE